MATSVIKTDKGMIEFTLRGRGKAVLIIPGGHIDCRETIFQKGLDPNNYCFITPSRPGYGKTPLTDFNKTSKGTADLLITLLDKLKITKATVIGISAGGLTSLEIAANYPDRIERLVLMSALTKKWFVETDKTYKGGKKIFAPKIEWITWELYRLFFRIFPKMMTKTMFRELSKYRPVDFTKDEMRELKGMTMKMRSSQGFSNDLDQSIDQGTLGKIKCPTLILHGNYDNSVDLTHPHNAKSKINNSRLVLFNNRWGHLLWLGKEYDSPLDELKKAMK
ncbi:alpha/beta hydrolase [Olivibacter sp. SDN3]|uniref:alpha/beta fold hydrolase n=1 Tax=Olivibacter sp. SDN3 TaxID=2764720 RepID=UPI0016510E70|nr:alpha/beta hydrolase [Olivibacter sp. SDN3]QNL52178.1 alpha/beta hydrolase [Olivibacter sp. SDN3]